ncbi:MAG TPA: DUF2812 domain-containing protein [Ureibacillus sp.]|nr:DUF2812 domain-containing protein [Ureibacillus sp.]
MRKFKIFFDIEKEEKWLNEQLQKGYHCTHISGLGVYTFEKSNKNYVMRLDYQDYLSKDKFEEYKGIHEDFGWNFIKGSSIGGVHYWQKEDDHQNELFSDRQSTSNYYKRLMGYSSGLGIVFLLFSYMLYKDSGLYLTEGLWNMKGDLFWKALLFETPFVFLRLLPALMAIFYGISFYNAFRKYAVTREK